MERGQQLQEEVDLRDRKVRIRQLPKQAKLPFYHYTTKERQEL